MTTYLVEISSDLFPVTHPEDGSIMDGERFFLTATSPEGRRFVHHQSFKASFRSQREDVIAAVSRYQDKVTTAQRLGRWAGPEKNLNWTEVTPAYGSALYAQSWEDYQEADALNDRAGE